MIKLSYRNKLRLRQVLKSLLLIFFLFLLLGSLFLIYMQRYVVYHRERVSFDFSQTTQNISPAEPSDAAATTTQKREEVEILYMDDSSTTGSLRKVNGYYITGEQLSADPSSVAQSLRSLQEPCWILLDLKDEAGNFYYTTSITDAKTASLDIGAIDQIISDLKARGFTLIARLPAFADTAFALEHTDCALQLESGALWADAYNGYWLDPANSLVQDYLQQVCKELSSLGFTEVVFDDFYFPTSGEIAYESSQTKSEISESAAIALKSAFTDSNLTISFCMHEITFPLSTVSGRIYFSDVSGENLDTVSAAAQGVVAEQTTQLVFLTDSHDTRFDTYGVLRPLPENESSAQENETDS